MVEVVIGAAVVLVVMAALGVLLAVRVSRLRSSGTAVLFRSLPAGDDRGWRHGTIRYTDDAVRFHRLSSLRTGPSRVFARQSIELVGRRAPAGTEFDVLDAMTVVAIRVGEDRYEIAMSAGAITAFSSWLESRPSVRSQRRRSA
ncbi:DUF2550 domain-containing protein [Williamsia sp. CHRR-6]|uniref:DUF2550 domain-containing protein n=1 Tax=Williamsia sp. CHRR-6 TaxID=2835871 RepID=UPI001BD9AFA5|nr:DUF2550 domain-containing protein [Williamsia sp. CHRR-6]MBT0568415.1 DUF2550 domain-containing protein [Williamsia sp. CHRR-6]